MNGKENIHIMKKSTKEKLRKHAIENGFGGYVEKEHICEQCDTTFRGTPNQLRCGGCINKGHSLTCKYCDDRFYSKYKNTKYCPLCVENKVWLGGKRPKYIGDKISKSKKKWYKTSEGKLHAIKLGKVNSQKMKQYYQTDEGEAQKKRVAKKLSKIMKDKIRNGEFTPNITNTFTHWDAVIELKNGEIKKFRSSWEACFWYCNKHLLYENIRIPYVDEYGDKKTYIADFFDDKTNMLYEIKPKKYYLKQSYKMDKIIEYCKKNDYIFKWVNEFNIMNYVDKSIFNGNNKDQLNKLLEGINEKN